MAKDKGKAQPARWQVWRFIPAAKLWQAVALSLNIEPAESLAADAARGYDSYSRLPRDYFDRLAICKANLSTHGPIRPQGALYSGMLSDLRCTVLLADMGEFLVGAGLTVPDEMRKPLPTDAPQNQESKEQREDRRLKACEDAGLTMPDSYLGRLPNGVGSVAKTEGVSRQSLADDIKEALKRRGDAHRSGRSSSQR